MEDKVLEAIRQVSSQMVQQVAGQLQQAPQEEQGETAPESTEQSQEMAQQGGEKNYMQQAGFSFPTRYAPPIAGYDITGKSVVDKDMLTGVEPIQTYTGSGYGQQMANIEDLINVHSWYFDTPEKKEAFREATKKEGSQPEVREFQVAYNKEILDRAKKAGIPTTETNNIIKEVGFTEEGARKLDGLIGAFTSTRPLYSFEKSKDGGIKITETPVTKPIVETRNITKNVLPLLPDDLRLTPSAINPIYKEQITLGRADPTKLTVEPFLANQESQRQVDVARVQASGLPTAQQEALLSQGLATSQISTNDAIAKVEMANQQNQARVDQFNLGQRSKEDLTNLQFGQQYEQQMLGGLNVYESALRNYYTEQNLQNRSNYRDIENVNMLNSVNENYQYLPGIGTQYLPSQTTNLALPSLPTNIYQNMTPEQVDAYKRQQIAKARMEGMKNYTTTIQTP